MKESLEESEWYMANKIDDGDNHDGKHYCDSCWSIGDEDELVLSESRKVVKKLCENKIDGSCPLPNIHCNFPDCEKDL